MTLLRAAHPFRFVTRLNLIELTGLKAYSLGTAFRYDGPKVSFDRPELSPCLQGMEISSAASAEVLAIIRSGKETLQKTPRADMPGFVPFETDLKRQAHHEKYQAIEQDVRKAIREKRKIMDSDSAAPETKGL